MVRPGRIAVVGQVLFNHTRTSGHRQRRRINRLGVIAVPDRQTKPLFKHADARQCCICLGGRIARHTLQQRPAGHVCCQACRRRHQFVELTRARRDQHRFTERYRRFQQSWVHRVGRSNLHRIHIHCLERRNIANGKRRNNPRQPNRPCMGTQREPLALAQLQSAQHRTCVTCLALLILSQHRITRQQRISIETLKFHRIRPRGRRRIDQRHRPIGIAIVVHAHLGDHHHLGWGLAT